MSKVLISVVMPCYNSEKFIEDAIQSILDQTFEQFELLIVNDGSTDATEDKIKNYKDPRIRYFKFTSNRGNYPARNKGLFEAQGKYICMMDSDDISLPNRLQKQYNYLESNLNVGCVGSAYEIIDKNGESKGVIRRPKHDSMIKIWLLSNPYIYQPTIMFRNDLIKKKELVYDESFQYAGDYDFVVRLSKVADLSNISEVLVNYRNHSEQISTSKKLEQRRLANVVRKQQLERLGVTYNDKALALHLKLMRNEYIDDSELEPCYQWLSKLLKANHEKNIYNTIHFYKFFKQIFQMAVFNNALGGWSIEKEILQHIKTLLPKGKSILEFGSGKGTEALLRDYKVTSVEHDDGFCFKRDEKHEIILVPITNDWYASEMVQSVLSEKYDLIIIDGPTIEFRQGILNNIELFDNVLSPILFNNIDRENDRNTMIGFCDSLDLNYEIKKGRNKDFAICTIKA